MIVIIGFLYKHHNNTFAMIINYYEYNYYEIILVVEKNGVYYIMLIALKLDVYSLQVMSHTENTNIICDKIS